MRVTVTHLKAPWPAGAGVGSVVEFDGAVPACFAGKFAPAAEDAEVSHRYEPPAPPPALLDGVQPLADADALKALLQISEQEAGELRQRVETAEAKAAELGAQLQGLQEQLDAALAAKAAEASSKTPGKASK